MGGPGKPVCSRENKGGQNGDMTRLPGDVGNLIRDTTMKDERGGTVRVHKRTTDILALQKSRGKLICYHIW